MAWCHMSKNRMPARQITVGTRARVRPNTHASARIPSPDRYQGESASRACSGLSSAEVTPLRTASAAPPKVSTNHTVTSVTCWAIRRWLSLRSNSAAQKYSRET